MFRRYFWQLLGTILALLAIFATYDVFLRSRPSKSLQVILQPTASLVDVRPDVAADIEIRYKGLRVASASVVQLRIENSGNQPILESDYSRPITFSFSPEHEIVDATVIGTDPPNIGMRVNKNATSQVTVAPSLLNPQDSVTLRFVTVSSSKKPPLAGLSVDGRIVGVKEVKLVLPSEATPRRWPEWLALLAAVIGALASFLTGLGGDILTRWRQRRARRLEQRADSEP